MLAVLSTIRPDHDLFKKNYVKPKKTPVEVVVTTPSTVPNINNFFDGLKRCSGGKRGKTFTKPTPTQVCEAKMEKLKA